MSIIDPDLVALRDAMRIAARRPSPAKCIRAVIVDCAFSHWETFDDGVWRRATMRELRHVLAGLGLRGAAADKALGSLLCYTPRQPVKWDRYCRPLLDGLLSDFHVRLVQDWLSTKHFPPNLTFEDLRRAFALDHPGVEVEREIFELIREA